MNKQLLLRAPLLIGLLAIGLAIALLGSQTYAQEGGPNAVIGVDADVGSSFTYQGYLQKDGSATNGSCDLEFKLYDASSGGSQVGSTQTRTGTSVTQGRFTVELDFGSSVFDGQARWLEIGVRCPAGSGNYTTLSPRQSLTPAPYAHSLRPGAVIEGDVSAPAGILNLTNNGSGSGARVVSANDGLVVESATNNGVYVIAASNGLRVGSVATGLLVNSSTTGVHVNSSVTGVKVDSASEAGVLVDSATLGVGFQANYAGKDGLYVCATGSENPNTCENRDGNNGVEIYRAEDYGVYVENAGDDGFIVAGAGDNGFQAGVITEDGFYVTEAGVNGFSAKQVGQDGLFICAAGNVSATPCDNRTGIRSGVEILRAESYGVYVEDAGDDGFIVAGAGDDGFSAGVITDDGFYVTEAGGDGLEVQLANGAGVRVQSAPNGAGLYVISANTGVNVESATAYGLYVKSANTGIYVNGPVTNWAGYFTGSVNVTGTCTGCVLAAMAVNTGDSALQPGDVVALRGSRVDATTGQPLLMEVGRATSGAPLVGVVYGRGELTEVAAGEGQVTAQIVPRAGAAQPGDFVHIVLDGPAQVKASALDGLITLGQKLTVADDGAARALKSVEVDGVKIAESASTIGMALEDSAASADDLIWVLVNPQ